MQSRKYIIQTYNVVASSFRESPELSKFFRDISDVVSDNDKNIQSRVIGAQFEAKLTRVGRQKIEKIQIKQILHAYHIVTRYVYHRRLEC